MGHEASQEAAWEQDWCHLYETPAQATDQAQAGTTRLNEEQVGILRRARAALRDLLPAVVSDEGHQATMALNIGDDLRTHTFEQSNEAALQRYLHGKIVEELERLGR